MNISQCIFNQPDAIGIIRYGDLKEFALELIAEAERKAEERLRREATEQADKEERLSRADVAKLYKVSQPTLTRWAREGYLKPDGYIGRKPYYHAAKIERIIASKKGDL